MKISFLHNILSMEKAVAGVELQTGHKTCVIECGHCNFTQDVTDQVNTLDPEVETTFDLVQHFLTVHGLRRYLNYGFPLKGQIEFPTPRLFDPSLLTQVQVGFGRMRGHHESNVEEVAIDTIKKLDRLVGEISEYNYYHKDTVPGPIGLSFQFGPKGVAMTEGEMALIMAFYAHYRPFLQKNNYGEATLSFDLNMVPAEQILKNMGSLVEEKEYFVKELRNILLSEENLGSYSITDQESLTESKEFGARIFGYRVATKREGHSFAFRKRLISKTSKDTTEKYYSNASVYVDKKDSSYVSIYPHGILINHSSLEVHNPFLWTSHERLRDELQKCIANNLGSQGTLSDITGPIITENLGEYSKNGKFSSTHNELVAKSILHPKI